MPELPAVRCCDWSDSAAAAPAASGRRRTCRLGWLRLPPGHWRTAAGHNAWLAARATQAAVAGSPGPCLCATRLQVAELHTLLVEADRSRASSCWSWLLNRLLGAAMTVLAASEPTLKPDSYVRLGIGAYEYSYFIEVDRATEGSRAVERQLGATPPTTRADKSKPSAASSRASCGWRRMTDESASSPPVCSANRLRPASCSRSPVSTKPWP